MKKMNKSNKQRKQPGQGLVEFALALPVFLLLAFGIVEFARIFSALLIVENSARTAARYAVTGQFDKSHCATYFSTLPDPQAAANCDLTLTRDLTGQDHWAYDMGQTPQGLCDAIFPVTGYVNKPVICQANTDLTFEDVVGAMQDAARVASIATVARNSAPSLSIDDSTTDNTSRGWFRTVICSSRHYAVTDSTPNPRAAYFWQDPLCTRRDPSGNNLNEEFDAGGPNDQVTVRVMFNHPLITPVRAIANNVGNWIRLSAIRTMVVERFRTARVFGLPPIMDLPTPIPSATPTKTSTPTKTTTPTPTNTSTPTNTPTSTPTPVPNCNQIDVAKPVLWNNTLLTWVDNYGPYNIQMTAVTVTWPTGQFPALGGSSAYMDFIEWNNSAFYGGNSTSSPVVAAAGQTLGSITTNNTLEVGFANWDSVKVSAAGGTAVSIGSTTNLARNFVQGADFTIQIGFAFPSPSTLRCSFSVNGLSRPVVALSDPPTGTNIAGQFTVRANNPPTDADTTVPSSSWVVNGSNRKMLFEVYNSAGAKVLYHGEGSAAWCGWSNGSGIGGCGNALVFSPNTCTSAEPYGQWLYDGGTCTNITNGNYVAVAYVQDTDSNYGGNNSYDYDARQFTLLVATPTPSRTPTNTPTRTPTATPSNTPPPTATNSPTPTWNPKTPTVTRTPTAVNTATKTSTPRTPTKTNTPITPTKTSTPVTPLPPTKTSTPTWTPIPLPTQSD